MSKITVAHATQHSENGLTFFMGQIETGLNGSANTIDVGIMRSNNKSDFDILGGKISFGGGDTYYSFKPEGNHNEKDSAVMQAISGITEVKAHPNMTGNTDDLSDMNIVIKQAKESVNG